MTDPDSNLQPERTASTFGGVFRLLLGVAFFLVLGWVIWLSAQIQNYAHQDHVEHADAIAVFGAAEYDGRPSPVLHARLDHGLELYEQGIAPLIITLGGGQDAGTDKDEPKSEGGVGRTYLLAHGVPEQSLIAETQSSNTEQSVDRLVLIARENHLQRIVVVSDGTHLFRIHELCQKAGLDVFTSPRVEMAHLDFGTRLSRLMHEMLGYTAWRLHLH